MHKRIALVFVLGLGSGIAGGFYLGRITSKDDPPTNQTTTPPEAAPAEIAQPLSVETEPAAPTEAVHSEKLKLLDLSITRSLYNTLERHFDGRQADILNAQLGRILVWWIDLRRDVLAQDRVQVIYQPSQNENDVVAIAIRYTSAKKQQTYSAYRFKTQAARYSRYYYADGKEIETRLQNGPIENYEQVTELMNLAGRRHKGIDFKTDQGTIVSAPFRARVTRRNWNTRRNGFCLELFYLDSNITAVFLHLDEVLPGIHPKKVVEAGTPVAKTGNTGRSTAPHLHYELHSPKGRLLNPFGVHSTTTRRLTGDHLTKFVAHRKKLDQMFDGEGSIDESL